MLGRLRARLCLLIGGGPSLASVYRESIPPVGKFVAWYAYETVPLEDAPCRPLIWRSDFHPSDGGASLTIIFTWKDPSVCLKSHRLVFV